MRKLITVPQVFIIGLICSSVALAAAGDLQLRKVYNDLQASKTAFLNSEIIKQDFIQKFKILDAEIKARYAQIQILEGDGLSIEGNQTALDVELLEPLRILSRNSINKNSCNEAQHQNQLNASPDEIAQLKLIENLITKLCQ